MSGKDSYYAAYNAKCKEQVAYNEASKLLLKPEIQERIRDINKPLEEAYQSTSLSNRQNQIDFIKSRIELCKTKEDEQSIIRYTDMLNKLYGLYNEELKLDKKDSEVVKLDTNTLHKLVSIS